MKSSDKIKVKLFTIFQTSLILFLVVLVGVFVAVMRSENPEWSFNLLGIDRKSEPKYEVLKFLGIGMGGVLVALQALMSYKRAKAMEETADAQANAVLKTEQGQRQERMKNAIEHLGHESHSVRLGGAYELFHLAEDTATLRQTVLDILCAHIRQTTGDEAYRREHNSKPSEEVQSLLTLLFVQDHSVFKALHINLQGSWLNGANLRQARFEGAILSETHLNKADLGNSRLQYANLYKTNLQGAYIEKADLRKVNLVESRMQKAILSNADLRGAILNHALLQGAILTAAHLQEAGLNGTHMKAANLALARMQLASLGAAQMQGAYLHNTKLYGATLRDAQMQGTYLRAAQLHEAKFSSLQGLKDFGETFSEEINPERAQLQGVDSFDINDSTLIADQIRNRKNIVTDLSGVIFAGGLRQQDVDSVVEGLSDSGIGNLRARLEPHIGQPISHNLPEDSGAITGTYSEEEAENWIAEYEAAISEVPEDDS